MPSTIAASWLIVDMKCYFILLVHLLHCCPCSYHCCFSIWCHQLIVHFRYSVFGCSPSHHSQHADAASAAVTASQSSAFILFADLLKPPSLVPSPPADCYVIFLSNSGHCHCLLHCSPLGRCCCSCCSSFFS